MIKQVIFLILHFASTDDMRDLITSIRLTVMRIEKAYRKDIQIGHTPHYLCIYCRFTCSKYVYKMTILVSYNGVTSKYSSSK